MRLTFIGATRTVTGSSFLVETDGRSLLIDCGLYQGSRQIEERNRQPFPFSPGAISEVALTHAHIDHSGLLPRLTREGFKGRILAHRATADLAAVMLLDSAHIQEMDADRENKRRRRRGIEPQAPVYTTEDARAAGARLSPVDYGTAVEVLGGRGTLRLLDAGHILGSSVVCLDVSEAGRRTRVVASGDLGNSPAPILEEPVSPEAADVVLIESTYGNRLHEDRSRREEKLADAVTWAARRQGKVIIPAFAVGRTQEILYSLSELRREGRVPAIPVYIDSPLARKATEVFRKHPECWDARMRERIESGDDPFEFPGLTLVEDARESMALNTSPGPAVVISASGMCNAGRILHHLKHGLWRPENVVLIVGWQGQGSLGRQLVDGAGSVRVLGETVAVKARIIKIGGFSAHADADGLLAWLRGFGRPPRTVFVVHGEETAAEALAGRIQQEMGLTATVPRPLESYEVGASGVERTGAVVAPPADADDGTDELVAELEQILSAGAERASELERRLASGPAAGGRSMAPEARERLSSLVGRLGRALGAGQGP